MDPLIIPSGGYERVTEAEQEVGDLSVFFFPWAWGDLPRGLVVWLVGLVRKGRPWTSCSGMAFTTLRRVFHLCRFSTTVGAVRQTIQSPSQKDAVSWPIMKHDFTSLPRKHLQPSGCDCCADCLHYLATDSGDVRPGP